eukprot:8586740-Pyramimonas_sp.AAC.1
MHSYGVAISEDFWQAPGGDAIVARVAARRKGGMGHDCWRPLVERNFADSDDIADAVAWRVVPALSAE